MNNKEFVVFPAIDLHNGQVVRLRQGIREDKTKFDLSPKIAAENWIAEGAKWLHVINLDGAFGDGAHANIGHLRQILSEANGAAEVQFGGGVRDLASIDYLLSLGISRVIIGTAAIKNPNFLKDALKTFGADRVVLGVDSKDEKVRISGWEENSGISPIALIEEFIPNGLRNIIFTNIRRDGMQTGVDIQTTQKIAKVTGIKVIASGGVANLQDIHLAKEAKLAGLIIGKALYENIFTLSEALRC